MEWKESGAQSLKIAVVCTRAEVRPLVSFPKLANADLFRNMKDINFEAARRTFCGPGKSIPAAEIEALDAQIDDAKASGNRKLKKALKNRYINPLT
jgi:hypothetical protein